MNSEHAYNFILVVKYIILVQRDIASFQWKNEDKEQWSIS